MELAISIISDPKVGHLTIWGFLMKWKQYLYKDCTVKISQKVSPSVGLKSCYIWLDEIANYYSPR